MELLEDEGFEVQRAASGPQAVQALSAQPPPSTRYCAILLDMRIPDGGGLTVLKHLEQLGGGVPVIAMSASLELLEDATRAGVASVLRKPFELGDLVQQLIATVIRTCQH